MRDQDDNGDATDGGQTGQHGNDTQPPVSPPMGGAPSNNSKARALLIAAGFASLGALLAFLLGCLGEGSELAVELGLLLAVLAVVLDAIASQTQGGHVGGGGHAQPPVAPPSLAYVTTATILTALGLLSVMLQCALEQGYGSAMAGLLLLLLAAVADFIAAYKAQ